MIRRVLAALRGGASDPALKKLRGKLLAVNLIALTLIVTSAFSSAYISAYQRFQAEVDNALLSIPPGVMENVLRSQRDVAAGEGAAGGGGGGTGDGLTISGDPLIPIDYSKSFVANIMADGQITVFSLLDLGTEDYEQAIAAALEGGAGKGVIGIAGRSWRYSYTSGAGRGGPMSAYEASLVFLDVEDAQRRLDWMAVNFVVTGGIAIVVIFLISLIMANRAIRPVEESMARQRRFVADASHELKTPIAVIAANAEAARAAGGAEDAGRWIDNIADEANRMNGLVENLLALAKAEEKKAAAAEFDLVGVVCEEADRVEAFLFEKGVEFYAEMAESLTVLSDEGKVRAALSVLLENAVKYTPSGGRVTLTVGRREGGATAGGGAFASVSNTGAYIPPEELAHIFDRFYRADRSRSSETGGHGIGLSIAKSIAESIGGGLTAASAPQDGGGAVNTFTFFV